LLDEGNRVVAGHGRLRAAQLLGVVNVPTIRLDHLTPAQRRAYAIADNRIAELAGCDREILGIELQGLLELDLDFEITDLGFELTEIDVLLDERNQSAPEEMQQDIIPDCDDVPSISRPGDLWQLGEHLLFCGDALDPASYQALMGSDRATMIFSDPPYNVPIAKNVSGLGKNKHREFLQASGEMSSTEFANFLAQACTRMRDFSIDGSMHFICMDWRHIDALVVTGRQIYTELKNICVWVKPNGGMGTLYRSRHELVAVFKSGADAHCNNVQLGSNGRYRSNVWEYQGMSSFQVDREAILKMHPTVKPTTLIADAILDCSTRGEIILDPFAGS
jgi:DNA modification methylase